MLASVTPKVTLASIQTLSSFSILFLSFLLIYTIDTLIRDKFYTKKKIHIDIIDVMVLFKRSVHSSSTINVQFRVHFGATLDDFCQIRSAWSTI